MSRIVRSGLRTIAKSGRHAAIGPQVDGSARATADENELRIRFSRLQLVVRMHAQITNPNLRLRAVVKGDTIGLTGFRDRASRILRTDCRAMGQHNDSEQE